MSIFLNDYSFIVKHTLVNFESKYFRQ